MKKCSNKECKNINPQTLINFTKNKTRKDGLEHRCKDCHYKRKDIRRSTRKGKNYMKNYNLKREYGITLDIFNNMIKDQNNKCKICNLEFNNPKNIHVDHCHKTEKIRGLLCSNCNRALGLFKDNILILNNAINYLDPA